MSTLFYLIILVVGGVLSNKNFIPKKVYPYIERIQFACLVLMLASMGLKMGMDEKVVSSFFTIGVHSVLFGIMTIACSVLVVFLVIRFVNIISKSDSKDNKNKVNNANNMSDTDEKGFDMMSLMLVGIVFGGVAIGTLIDAKYMIFTENAIQFGLYLLLFFTGIDIGKKNIFDEVKSIKLFFILMPLSIVIGSLLGSAILAVVLKYPLSEAAAVGSGFGWYSLSAVIISPYSDTLAALAFMSNVIREILAIVTIPFIAKYIGYKEAIAPAGAAAMDTLLPLVSRSTNARTAILSFTTGVILSALVPILVPALLYL